MVFRKSLVKELSKNNNIFKISRKDKINKNNLIKTDIDFKIIDNNFKKQFENNFLYHLATHYQKDVESNNEASKIIESNILFGMRLINSFGKRFFSKIFLTQTYLELQSLNKFNLYSLSKSIFRNELDNLKINNVIKIYLYDTFGLRDKRRKLINIWLEKMLKNEPIEIYNEKKSINLISDSFFKIISKSYNIKPDNYELRSNVEITLLDLFDLLRDITNSKSEKILKDDYKYDLPIVHENLCDVLDLYYDIDNFKDDISNILNIEFKKF